MLRTIFILMAIMPTAMIRAQTLEQRQLQQTLQVLMQLQRDQGTGPASSPDPTVAQARPNAPTATFLIQQDGRQIQALPHVHETIFVKTKSDNSTDAWKAIALSEGIQLGATIAARKVRAGPAYFAGMSELMGGLNVFGRGKTRGFEFDFLRGSNAPVQLQRAALQIQLPPTTALGGTAEPGLEPLLLRLRVREKERVRIIASRKLQFAPAKSSAFTIQDERFERVVLSTEYESLPVSVGKNADGTVVVRVAQPAPGEYALVLQKPDPKAFQLLDTVLDFRISN